MSFSVLISVYSKENPQYLNEALCSIWDCQTRKPGQVVLVKDGTLTEELDICINTWGNKLGEILTVIELEKNSGLAIALNAGLQECRYELVARMDADDVSLPIRFEKQVAFMEENPDIVASSAVLEEWDDDFSKCIGIRTVPLGLDEVKVFAKYRNPLSHPVTIFRKSVIMLVGGYPALRTSQDYALWSLLLTKKNKLVNLQDVLHKQRAGNGLLDRRGFRYFKGELKLLKYQHAIAFLNDFEYMRNVFIRFTVRVFPGFIKNILYKYLR